MLELITTGISALGGGFMGALFTRQSQHHKLLLERRSEAFASFLELLDQAHRDATDVLFDRSLEEAARDLKVLDAYRQALNHARIVRLYLPRRAREEFYGLTKDYWALHTQPSLGDSRLLAMDKHLDRIQEIFEQQLSPYYWLRPVGRWWQRLTGRSSGPADAGR